MEKENPIENTEQETTQDIQNEDEGLISGEFIPKRGCLRSCLIPIVAIFIVLTIIGLLINSRRDMIRHLIIQRVITNTEKQAINNLPRNVDKKTIEDLFDSVKNAYKEGRIDENALESAIKEYIENTRNMSSPEMKKNEVEVLIKKLSEAMKSS